MVTFLFTDIEGSSQRWDRSKASMRTAVATHDALLDEAISRNRGHVVKKLGDGFMAAFGDPADAVESAWDAQRMIAGLDWDDAIAPLRVRMGIHTGPGEPSDGDYVGPSLNRAARIEAAGHGGQILTSAATRELSGDRIDGVRFMDLGEHHLRGVHSHQSARRRESAGWPSSRTRRTLVCSRRRQTIDDKWDGRRRQDHPRH
jgi:class 3 adenylate cyclase